jgi:hypothetical protein
MQDQDMILTRHKRNSKQLSLGYRISTGSHWFLTTSKYEYVLNGEESSRKVRRGSFPFSSSSFLLLFLYSFFLKIERFPLWHGPVSA